MIECIFCDDTRERLLVTNRQDKKDIGICNTCVVFIGEQQRRVIFAEIEYLSWLSPSAASSLQGDKNV